MNFWGVEIMLLNWWGAEVRGFEFVECREKVSESEFTEFENLQNFLNAEFRKFSNSDDSASDICA